MPLHLQKLCVGADSIEDLERWIAFRLDQKKKEGLPAEQTHTTRMAPKRKDELLDGGSLYWVVKGLMCCRQRLIDIRPVKGEDGITRYNLVLEPKVVRTEGVPRRPFQGWRYLSSSDAPADIGGRRAGRGIADIPPEMRRELRELCLI